MKQTFFILLCLLGSLKAWCQDSTLTQVLAAKDDTLKVKNLLKLERQIRNQDLQKAKEICSTVISISRRLKYNEGIGNGILNLGFHAGYAGEYDRSVQYFLEALGYFQKANDSIGVAKCYVNLGTAYSNQAKSDSTILYYVKGAEILENKKNYTLLTHTYVNLGALYANSLKNIERSVFYYKKAEGTARLSKDTAALVGALNGLVSRYRDLKDTTAAYRCAVEAINLARGQKNKNLLGRAYNNYAIALTLTRQHDAAVDAAKMAISYLKMANSVQDYLGASVTLAIALKAKGDYAAIIPVLEEALQKCKEVNNVVYQRDIYERLASAHYGLKNYETAYDYLKDAFLYHDSTLSAENSRLIAEMDTKYQLSQKEKALSAKQLQIANNEVQLQKNRQYTLVSIGATLVALLVAGLVYANLKHKKKQHIRQMQSLQQQKEIQLLQAVMQGEEKERSRIAKDLHDGVAGMLAAVKMHFNTIALHVGGVLQTEGYQQGLKLLDEASQEVRKTSHNLMPEVLLQHGLDEAIRRYCNNVTNSSKLLVQYDSIGEVDRFVDSFELSVYRIVQELLNNIVKHSRASEAIVQLTFQSHLLAITIEDNGIGLSTDGQQKDGIGLKSLESRVKAMNGKIEFDSTAGQGLNAYLEFETIGLEKKPQPAIA